ncbi:unnamed protein product, partial [Rhizoctonia solani]
TVKGVQILNNQIINNDQALRIKTKADATNAAVSGITFSGNTATGTKKFGVIVDQGYPTTLGTPGNGVTISDINFTGSTNNIAVASSAQRVAVNCGTGCTGTWDWSKLTVTGGKAADSKYRYSGIKGESKLGRLLVLLMFETETSISDLLLVLKDPSNVTLDRSAHAQWAYKSLIQGLPARYTSQDASQPWLIYWALQGLTCLGVQLDPTTKQRTIDTILANQHPDGGFGGGPGQIPHLLPTYASVCALAIVGKPGEKGGWDQINRQKCYEFFMRMKQPDGSFVVNKDAEVDVRGTYCLLVTATLLDILTPELAEGTSEFLRSCQTYEGGFASSSHPYYSAGSDKPQVLSEVRPTLGESHGGYTSCAVASWVLLQPYQKPEDPKINVKKLVRWAAGMQGDKPQVLSEVRPTLGESHGGYTSCAVASWVLLQPYQKPEDPKINVKKLVRWAAGMQGLPIEGGGFRGRSNKLVDGCYSWWIGGLEPLLLDLLGLGNEEGETEVVSHVTEETESEMTPHPDPLSAHNEEGETEVVSHVTEETESENGPTTLFDRTSLQRFTLVSSQLSSGGLRDKPGKPADLYHTTYNLAGYSTAQHRVYRSLVTEKKLLDSWKSSEGVIQGSNEQIRKATWAGICSWQEDEGAHFYLGGEQNRVEDEGAHFYLGGEQNRVNATHPLFNLTMSHTRAIANYFYQQKDLV